MKWYLTFEVYLLQTHNQSLIIKNKNKNKKQSSDKCYLKAILHNWPALSKIVKTMENEA